MKRIHVVWYKTVKNKVLPLKSSTSQGCWLGQPIFNIILEAEARATMQGKK